jgi:hypothetical protein
MQLLTKVHSRTAEPTLNKPTPSGGPPPEVSSLDALWRQVRDDASAGPALARALGGEALRVARDPLKAVREGTEFALSMRRVVDPAVGPGDPLLSGRGLGMRLATMDVPFRDFRAAAKAGGGTVNDAYIAALLGGYRRYHEAMGAPMVDTVPTGFPISVRKAGDSEGGNHIVSARIAGPVAERDPVLRIARIRELVQAARTERAINVMNEVAPAMSRLPAGLVAKLAGPMTTGNDLMASNVPGIGDGYYLAGARVERFFGYGRSGSAALITFISHGDSGCVGVGMDPAAITEPELFVDCIADGFIEVLALNPGSGAPKRYT